MAGNTFEVLAQSVLALGAFRIVCIFLFFRLAWRDRAFRRHLRNRYGFAALEVSFGQHQPGVRHSEETALALGIVESLGEVKTFLGVPPIILQPPVPSHCVSYLTISKDAFYSQYDTSNFVPPEFCCELGGCPLWVISGHRSASSRCPLYPRKRTFRNAAAGVL